MRNIKEVLRLKAAGRGHDEMARACGVVHSTMLKHLRRAEGAGLGWPLPDGLTDADLERRLFPAEAPGRDEEIRLPAYQHVQDELRRWRAGCSLTLMQLWNEYKEQHPDGNQYSQLCRLGGPRGAAQVQK